MDDIEKQLRRYRPAGPPPDLRERITALAASERLARRSGWVREWLPAVAAAIVAALFSWMAANERQLIAAHVPPPPDDMVMNVSMEQ